MALGVKKRVLTKPLAARYVQGGGESIAFVPSVHCSKVAKPSVVGSSDEILDRSNRSPRDGRLHLHTLRLPVPRAGIRTEGVRHAALSRTTRLKRPDSVEWGLDYCIC